MEDSFFGFDTSISYDEDGNGGQIEEPSEEEYDALNDETFGSAINTDWEEAHESMVLLDDQLDDGDDDLLVNHVRKIANSNKSIKNRTTNKNTSNASSRQSTPAAMQPNRVNRHNKLSTADSDLELNLSNMKLDEVDFRFNESYMNVNDAGVISMDPSVWSSNPMQISKNYDSSYSNNNNNNNNVVFNSHASAKGLTETSNNSLSDSFHSKSMEQQQQQPPPHGLPKLPNSSNICTLEDIERNIILAQTMHKQQQQQPRENEPMKMSPQQIQQKSMPQQSPIRPSTNFQQNQQLHPLGVLMQQQQQQQQPLPPQQPPLPALQHQQPPQQLGSGARLPPGFAPIYQGSHVANQNYAQLPVHHPLLAQQPHHGLHGIHPLQRQPLPIALNNFAMHPNFNPMRAASTATISLLAAAQQQQASMVPAQQVAANTIGMANNQQQYNIMNIRMMQEIQQNHPMLQQQSRPHLQQQMQQQQQQHPHHMQPHMDQRNGKIHPLQLHQLQQQQQHYQQHLHQHQQHLQQQQQQQLHRNNRTNMSNQRDYDEYANLMSTRDKHWLIGIQLSQLNVDTPYIDDFYFTIYKERQVELRGEMRNSKAHKDNQLNHPLTQPRGHAQLILVQLGNKNGTRNGQNRERRNSDVNNSNSQNNNNNNNHHHHNNNNGNNNHQDKSPYVFTPMKFENSLGKLQYGSVTAPRKIIDADIMGSDAAANLNVSGSSTVGTPNGFIPVRPKTPAVTTLGAGSYIMAGGGIGSSGNMVMIQHKTRDLLLHIETLFRIVLKLEDLKNPAAVQSIKLKKKKEAERLAIMEQQENANKTQEEINNAAEATTAAEDNGNSTKPKCYYEIEPEDELLESLMSGLTADKVVAIMNVRKGKILIRRVLPFITDDNLRWNIWISIFQSLQNIVKKDRDDSEGLLYALYPEFKKQIQNANFKTVMRFSNAMSLNDKKSDGIFCSRFGISALVCLVTRSEQIYQQGTPEASYKEQWSAFLNQMAASLDRTIQNQTICAAIELDAIEALVNHVNRFKHLQLDSLHALIAKARKQINLN